MAAIIPPAMRNALLPLAAILLICIGAGGMLLAQPRAQPGEGGPELDPGPMRLATKARYQVASAPLSGASTTVSGATADPSATPWRVVVLVAGDRHALTRAAIYGLGERLALAYSADGKPGKAGVVPIIVPVDTLTTLFGIPADRVLVVSHRQGSPPTDTGAALDCTLEIVERVPRLPADHPGAGLQAGSGHAERRWTVHHVNQGSAGAAWASWYAGVGRHIADSVITTIGSDLTGHGTALDGWTALDGPLVEPPQLKPEAFGAGRLDLLEWQSAFQTPLVRGWVGVLPTPTYTKADGRQVPVVDMLGERLVDRAWKFGGWTPITTDGPDRQWTKTLTGRLGPDAPEGTAAPQQIWTISARPNGAGWLVCAWQERPQAAALFQAWVDAAKAGDTAAKDRVAAHLGRPRLPADLLAAAKTALGL
jgi:hypothetical protein